MGSEAISLNARKSAGERSRSIGGRIFFAAGTFDRDVEPAVLDRRAGDREAPGGEGAFLTSANASLAWTLRQGRPGMGRSEDMVQ